MQWCKWQGPYDRKRALMHRFIFLLLLKTIQLKFYIIPLKSAEDLKYSIEILCYFNWIWSDNNAMRKWRAGKFAYYNCVFRIFYYKSIAKIYKDYFVPFVLCCRWKPSTIHMYPVCVCKFQMNHGAYNYLNDKLRVDNDCSVSNFEPDS